MTLRSGWWRTTPVSLRRTSTPSAIGARSSRARRPTIWRFASGHSPRVVHSRKRKPAAPPPYAFWRSEERRVGKSVDLGGRRIIKKKKKKLRGIDVVVIITAESRSDQSDADC